MYELVMAPDTIRKGRKEEPLPIKNLILSPGAAALSYCPITPRFTIVNRLGYVGITGLVMLA